MRRARARKAWTHWATAAGLSAVAAATGCAQQVLPAPPPAVGGPAAAARFPIVMQGNHAACGTCGTRLSAEGRHRIGEVLVRNLRYMASSRAFTAIAAPGAPQLKTNIIEAIAKIGPSKLGFRVPAEAAPELPAGDRVNQFPDPCPTDQCWRDYVARHPNGCCIPDGVPAPDAPY